MVNFDGFWNKPVRQLVPCFVLPHISKWRCTDAKPEPELMKITSSGQSSVALATLFDIVLVLGRLASALVAWMVGLIYVFNLIVGTGALAIPKAFQDAGFGLGLIILSILAFFSYVTATFLLEVMSASNALLQSRRMVTVKNLAIMAANDDPTSSSDVEQSMKHDEDVPLLKSSVCVHAKPQYFEITQRVELGHMAELFLNKWGQLLFNLCLILYLFGDLSIYATVVPKSLAHVICTFTPNMTGGANCTIAESDPCWAVTPLWLTRMTVYRFLVVAFAIVVGPFVYTNVSKTKYLQMFTTFSRWFAFFLMIILTSIFLAETKHHVDPPAFDFKSFAPLFGVCVYGFMCHHSLPAVITPIKRKSRLMGLLLMVFTMVLLFYASLALTGVFTFRSVSDVYTLDFQPDLQCTGQARNDKEQVTNNVFFQYFLALFPVFTLSTNFPIIGITLRNNVRKLLVPEPRLEGGRCIRSASAADVRSVTGQDNGSSAPLPASSFSRSRSGSDGNIRSRLSGILSPSSTTSRHLDPHDVPLILESPDSDRFLSMKLIAADYVVPTMIIIVPSCIAIGTQDVEFLVSIVGSYAGVGVQYILPAVLTLVVRRKLHPDMIDIPMPDAYFSPFRSILWVYFILVWSVFTVVIVTINITKL